MAGHVQDGGALEGDTRKMTTKSQKSSVKDDCEFCDLVQKELEAEKIHGKSKPKLTKTGKVLLGIAGATFVTVTAVTTPFVLPALRRVCLPYVPATTRQVQNVLKVLQGRTGTLIDLGSGDGRIVIEAARAGFRAEGVELNPWLVWYSRLSALRHGVRSSTSFYTRDLWKMDLSKYDNVVVFGVGQMMPTLEQKLSRELQTEGQVVACRFPLPTSVPSNSIDEGIDTVWLYTKHSLPKPDSLTSKT